MVVDLEPGDRLSVSREFSCPSAGRFVSAYREYELSALTDAVLNRRTRRNSWRKPGLGGIVPNVHIRSRAASDLDACEALASAVRALDGYPPHLPHELRSFISTSDAFEAWVAEEDEQVLGHVSLHRTSSDEVMALACKVLGARLDALGVVARLFVAPARRGQGIGGDLLMRATAGALARGLSPILDVATHFKPAIALYEKHGWVRIGQVKVAFRKRHLNEFVYVGPGEPVAMS